MIIAGCAILFSQFVFHFLFARAFGPAGIMASFSLANALGAGVLFVALSRHLQKGMMQSVFARPMSAFVLPLVASSLICWVGKIWMPGTLGAILWSCVAVGAFATCVLRSSESVHSFVRETKRKQN
jgi:peptidoglycan biosynthesis protein MviN/MurJ (putative lipid II flippase)